MREKHISFVLAGKNRRNILALLNLETLTPAQILKKANYTYLTHIIRTLKELNLMGLIECVNPEARSYKFYRITKLGKEVLKDVEKIKKEL
jgi:DNA-binding PadR family transcriptional regulator